MASEIQRELSKVTGVKKQVNEKPDRFLQRLHAAVLELPEDDWEALSTDAQSWTNDATDSIDANQPIGPFKDEQETNVATETTETPTPTAAKAKKAKSAALKAAPAPVEKKAKTAPKQALTKAPKTDKPAKTTTTKATKTADKPAKKAKGNGSREISAQETMKVMILKKPSLTVDEIIEKLEAKGFKPTPTRLAVASIRSSFRNSLKVIINNGGIPEGLEL